MFQMSNEKKLQLWNSVVQEEVFLQQYKMYSLKKEALHVFITLANQTKICTVSDKCYHFCSVGEFQQASKTLRPLNLFLVVQIELLVYKSLFLSLGRGLACRVLHLLPELS